MSNQEYIEKWLAGTLSKEEETLFAQTQESKDLQRMDQALKRFKPAELNWDASFEKIKSRKKQETKVVYMNWTSVLRVAAVLLLGISVLYFFSERFFGDSEMIYRTEAGETQQVTLPDHSVVTLNAKSSISFSKSSWQNERMVSLQGEAFFVVEKGQRFQVKTKSGTVAVLGTQFNVKDRNDFYEVTCYEGKVQVNASASPVHLTATQYYREINKQVIQSKLELTEVPAWFHKESSFESVPFKEVLDELTRQYDVRFIVDEVDVNQLFTGRFPNTDLSMALKSVTLPFGLNYEVKGKEIRVFHAK